MRNDLIIRSEAIKAVDKHIAADGKLDEDISVILEEVPVAYDVDAVCKTLDRKSDYYETNEQGKEHVQMVNLTEAFEIVRNGRIEN